jgi:hypothetical protein
MEHWALLPYLDFDYHHCERSEAHSTGSLRVDSHAPIIDWWLFPLKRHVNSSNDDHLHRHQLGRTNPYPFSFFLIQVVKDA